MFQGTQYHHGAVFRRDHDKFRAERQQLPVAGFFQYLLAVLAFPQVIVAENNIEAVELYHGNGFVAVPGRLNLRSSKRLDDAAHHLAHIHEIVDDEYFFVV